MTSMVNRLANYLTIIANDGDYIIILEESKENNYTMSANQNPVFRRL